MTVLITGKVWGRSKSVWNEKHRPRFNNIHYMEMNEFPFLDALIIISIEIMTTDFY